MKDEVYKSTFNTLSNIVMTAIFHPIITSLPSMSPQVKVTTPELSEKKLCGRDIIIINPSVAGGGDKVLANKIANIALSEGCRVAISSLDADHPENNTIRNISLRDDQPHDITQLNNPLFIVAPVAILKKEDLNAHIEMLCDNYQLEKKDIVLIEEMDLSHSLRNQIPHYTSLLKDAGFQNVSENRLGFDQGSIGYLPTDEQTLAVIRQRFEGELARLADSYNMSLTEDNHYHLAYISSDAYITGMQLFIANTLTDTLDKTLDANFIMVIRQFENDSSDKFASALEDILTIKSEDFDYPALFSKANVFFIDADNGKITNTSIINGNGQKNLNIFITAHLPKNIFEDFICLSHSGMASGDQSLSEYLSIKGKMPYYDMQPWKYQLVKSMENMADKEIKEAFSRKIVGKMPFSGEIIYTLAPNVNRPKPSPQQLIKQAELDRKLSSHTATDHIRSILSTVGRK